MSSDLSAGAGPPAQAALAPARRGGFRHLRAYYRQHGRGATLRALLLGNGDELPASPPWDAAVFQYASFQRGVIVVDGFVPLSGQLPASPLAFAVAGADGAVWGAQRMRLAEFRHHGAIVRGHRFRFAIAADMPPGEYACLAARPGRRQRLRIFTGVHFPLAVQYRRAYLRIDGQRLWRLLPGGGFALAAASRRRLLAAECAYCWELLRKPGLAGALAVLLRAAARVLRAWRPRRIWLFSDKLGNPFDSAFAVAHALLHRSEFAAEGIAAYYVVAGAEPRAREIARLVPTVKHMSPKHFLYYLLAEVNVTSEGGYNPFTPRTAPYRDLLARQLRVWSGHGIIHHDLSAIYGKANQNFNLLALGAARERAYLLEGLWGYGPEELALTGLARWDFRANRTRPVVYFIFTWRAALVAGIDEVTQQRRYDATFATSRFCRRLNSLLASGALRQAARAAGYELSFVPHPLLRPALRYFALPEDVTVVDGDKRYEDIYAEAALLVTDYSSVAMDMAYMGKPVIYYQFDREEFYATQGYTPSFFSWEEDGFGPVCREEEQVVAAIAAYMERGCVREEKFNRRAAAFFPPKDADNGYRTCRAILDKLRARGL